MYAIICGIRYELEHYEDVCNQRLSPDTAYIISREGQQYVLPCILEKSDEIGIYDSYPFRKINWPDDDNTLFNIENIIMFGNDGSVVSEIVDPTSMLIDADQVDMIRCEGAEVFAPPINDNDNMFNRMIKTVLMEKQLPIDAYRFTSMTEKNNLKRGIQTQNNMTADRYFQWCQILGIRNHHELSDEPSSKYPMNKTLNFEY